MKKLISLLLALALAVSPAALAAEVTASPEGGPEEAGQPTWLEPPEEEESVGEPPVWLEPPEEGGAEQAVPEEAPPIEAPPAEDAAPPPTQEEPGVFTAETPVISVSVPDSGQVIVNPYRLPLVLDGGETREQLAGSTLVLENRSTVAVDVSVSAVGTPAGGVVFVSEPPASDAPEKELFLYAEFQTAESPGAAVSWQGFFSDAPNQLLVTPYGLSKARLICLETAGAPYSWGAARLFGAAASSPSQPWQAGDGFRVNLAFTFTPAAPETPVLDQTGGANAASIPALSPEPDAALEPPFSPELIAVPDSASAPEPDASPGPAWEIGEDDSAQENPPLSEAGSGLGRPNPPPFEKGGPKLYSF